MATQRSLLPLHACYNTGTNTVLREGDEPRPKRAGVTQPMGLEGLTRRRREKMLGASCFTLRRQVGGGASRVSAPTTEETAQGQARVRPDSTRKMVLSYGHHRTTRKRKSLSESVRRGLGESSWQQETARSGPITQ